MHNIPFLSEIDRLAISNRVYTSQEITQDDDDTGNSRCDQHGRTSETFVEDLCGSIGEEKSEEHPAQSEMVTEFVRGDHRLAQVTVDPDAAVLAEQIAAVSKAVGATAITPEVGGGLALESAMVLGLLAMTNNPLFDVGDAETALITTLTTDDATIAPA